MNIFCRLSRIRDIQHSQLASKLATLAIDLTSPPRRNATRVLPAIIATSLDSPQAFLALQERACRLSAHAPSILASRAAPVASTMQWGSHNACRALLVPSRKTTRLRAVHRARLAATAQMPALRAVWSSRPAPLELTIQMWVKQATHRVLRAHKVRRIQSQAAPARQCVAIAFQAATPRLPASPPALCALLASSRPTQAARRVATAHWAPFALRAQASL